MPLALIYMIVRFVLALVAVLVRGDVSKEAELLVLRHENAVLRRQVSNPRYEPVDRIWFAALSRLVPRRLWPAVFPVTPATILRWHGAWSPANGPTPTGVGRDGRQQLPWSRS